MDHRNQKLPSAVRSVSKQRLSLIDVAACCCMLPLIALAQQTSNTAKLTYTRVLKGSVPEYLAVTVEADGSGTFVAGKLEEPPAPRPLNLSAATTRKLFELAAQLNNFLSPDLESHKKVANLGLKSLVYEDQGQKNRVEFNYTRQRDAQELATLFERIAGVMEHVKTLEYAMKYDHLSLPNQLSQIQIDLDKKVLADPELMVPVLEQITRNPRFLNLAKVRAQNILQRLQNTN